jgi:hypothetical protein
MPSDPTLLRHVLHVLRLYSGRPTPESTIASDVEIAAARPLTIDQVRDALIWLRDQNMVTSRTNTLRQEVWTITETGKSADIGL